MKSVKDWIYGGVVLFGIWAVICFLNATFWASLHDPTDDILWREGADEAVRQITALSAWISGLFGLAGG